jgi:hypothetical protein
MVMSRRLAFSVTYPNHDATVQTLRHHPESPPRRSLSGLSCRVASARLPMRAPPRPCPCWQAHVALFRQVPVWRDKPSLLLCIVAERLLSAAQGGGKSIRVVRCMPINDLSAVSLNVPAHNAPHRTLKNPFRAHLHTTFLPTHGSHQACSGPHPASTNLVIKSPHKPAVCQGLGSFAQQNQRQPASSRHSCVFACSPLL